VVVPGDGDKAFADAYNCKMLRPYWPKRPTEGSMLLKVRLYIYICMVYLFFITKSFTCIMCFILFLQHYEILRLLCGMLYSFRCDFTTHYFVPHGHGNVTLASICHMFGYG
jgi:hypothetical protein